MLVLIGGIGRVQIAELEKIEDTGNTMQKLKLRTALGKHAHIKPLRDGRVSSNRIEFDWVDMDPLPRAFRQMVRGNDLDLSEMAIVTHLMAHHFAKPIIGLAIPLWWRLPHANLVCEASGQVIGPKDLENQKVGVRAYSQTSGVWVRGILQHAYGVNLDSITWGTMEDSHLSEYIDPEICVRYPAQPSLRQLMLEGEFSAIMGERIVDPSCVRTVIPNATKAARAWIADSGITPVNHCVTLHTDLVATHDWLPAELMALFVKARAVAIEQDGAEAPPVFGLEHNMASLQCAFDFSYEQKITPRRYTADELFLPL